MLEVITTHTDGRQMCREIKEGEELKLYGDETAVQIYKKRRKKSK